MFVLDASVAVSWGLVDEWDSYCDSVLGRLAHSSAVVPSIWSYEVANAILVAERRGRLSEADSERFVELLDGLPIKVVDEVPGLAALISLGRSTMLAVYDAAYLSLAAREGLPLATRDARMRDAASRLGVQML